MFRVKFARFTFATTLCFSAAALLTGSSAPSG